MMATSSAIIISSGISFENLYKTPSKIPSPQRKRAFLIKNPSSAPFYPVPTLLTKFLL